jgi:hypothetical protein
MTKKPKSTAAEIAEEKMPGWEAVAPSGPIRPLGETQRDADAVRDNVSVDAVMPSTRQLRAKFLGADAVEGEADDSHADPLEADVELVDMKSGGIERTVGVNRKTKKIDWSQG